MKKIKRKLWLVVVSAMVVMLGFGCVGPQKKAEQPAPKAAVDWKFHTIVGVNYVMQSVGVPMPENVMVIDSRPKRAKYDQGHIPLAISIPDSKFAQMTDTLPKDKDALLIFYCGGPT